MNVGCGPSAGARISIRLAGLSFSKTGLLSLWKVLDQETSAFMIDFYRSFLDRDSVKAGYLATVRTHCRRNEQRVHPYYWAAFVFLDQEYK